MMQVKKMSDNEMYLLTKYIKSVLWRVATGLSYIEDARCLKVKVPTAVSLKIQVVYVEGYALLFGKQTATS